MKNYINFFAGVLIAFTLAFTGCKPEIESLSQEQMVSKPACRRRFGLLYSCF